MHGRGAGAPPGYGSGGFVHVRRPNDPRTSEGRLGGRPSVQLRVASALLQLDRPAGLLELGLELVGLLAVDALADGLRGPVDERLGLLQAEAGRRADDLDHLDLLVARGGEDDVDGARLLLDRGAVARGGAAGGGSGGGDRGRRDAELLLERLDALAELEHRDALELLDPLLGAGGHVLILLDVASAISGLRRSVRLVVVLG